MSENMNIKLRFCEEHGVSRGGAGAFCDFVTILYCDAVRGSSLAVWCFYDFVKGRTRRPNCGFASLAASP
jgi:hypothetical protein